MQPIGLGVRLALRKIQPAALERDAVSGRREPCLDVRIGQAGELAHEVSPSGAHALAELARMIREVEER